MDVIEQQLQNSTPVYNKYIKNDFQVGADNLNPKRELETTVLQSLEDLRMSLYLKYKSQIKTLSGENNIGAAIDLGLPYENRVQLTTTVPLREAMPPSKTSVPLESELNNMLKAMNAFLGGEPITLDDLPFDICNDRLPIDIPTGATPGGATISSGLTGADSTGNDRNPSIGKADTLTDVKCVMVEIEMLQIIFKILAFIKTLMDMEKVALSIIYPYIQFIQMVVACILNPAMLQQLALSLVGQAIAAFVSFLTDMLVQLLGNLNLDCILSNSLFSVQQVLGTIRAVGDTGSEVGSFIKFNNKLAATTANYLDASYKALQGDDTALAKALGLPEDKQQRAATMTAGELLTTAFVDGTAVPRRQVAGVAETVIGTGTGAVNTVTGTVTTLRTVATGLESTSGKTIKDYFPGAEVTTY